MHTKRLLIKYSLLICLFSVIASGCGVPKKVAYFQDATEETLILPNTGELKIRPNDKLSIIVKTMDPVLSSMFNLAVVSDRLGEGTVPYTGKNVGTASSSSSGISKYTVSPEGTIDLPVIGVVKVAGMTRFELAGFIKGELMGRNLAKDPVVTVEFINMGVSMMGEVKNPGLYDINQDKVTILEALSMAGDITLEGQRENIAVLREENGTVNTYRVDITNLKDLSQSPVYYLQQGDVVYVEPNDMKKRQTTTNGNNVYSTSFWISVASLLTSVVTTVGVFVIN